MQKGESKFKIKRKTNLNSKPANCNTNHESQIKLIKRAPSISTQNIKRTVLNYTLFNLRNQMTAMIKNNPLWTHGVYQSNGHVEPRF